MDYRTSNSSSVVSSCSATWAEGGIALIQGQRSVSSLTKLIKKDEGVGRGVLENGGRLVQFNKEGALTTHDSV